MTVGTITQTEENHRGKWGINILKIRNRARFTIYWASGLVVSIKEQSIHKLYDFSDAKLTYKLSSRGGHFATAI